MSRGCPFHSDHGGIALSEISGIVRCGDRVRMAKAIEQLESSLLRTEDLDEARGEGLTFLAMVTAATMEMGGSRAMHRVQLDAARKLEFAQDQREVADVVRDMVESILAPLFDPANTPSQILIDQALAYLAKNYHRDLTDELVARELGLSTSHFRHLFREATGQPFRRYLMSVRLERARQLIIEGEMPISEVAVEVGFTGLAHFSRAFAQRFAVSPTLLRRAGMAVSHEG